MYVLNACDNILDFLYNSFDLSSCQPEMSSGERTHSIRMRLWKELKVEVREGERDLPQNKFQDNTNQIISLTQSNYKYYTFYFRGVYDIYWLGGIYAEVPS